MGLGIGSIGSTVEAAEKINMFSSISESKLNKKSGSPKRSSAKTPTRSKSKSKSRSRSKSGKARQSPVRAIRW